MATDSLALLKEILPPHDTLPVDSEKGYVRIEIGQEYRSPDLDFNILRNLQDFFECENILQDTFSQEGCETCDYGSSYGYNITIIEPRNHTGISTLS